MKGKQVKWARIQHTLSQTHIHIFCVWSINLHFTFKYTTTTTEKDHQQNISKDPIKSHRWQVHNIEMEGMNIALSQPAVKIRWRLRKRETERSESHGCETDLYEGRLMINYQNFNRHLMWLWWHSTQLWHAV